MRIKEVIAVYLAYLQSLGRSAYSIRVTKYNLMDLVRFLETEKVYAIEELTADVMEEYQQELAFRLTYKGSLLTLKSQEKMLGTAKVFTRYLKEKEYLVHDPGERIKLPKVPKSLPRAIMSKGEVKRLLKAPDIHTSRGYRNRIIVEILYDTGIRRGEIANIKISDLDLDGGYIRIKGKGDKERVVPLSKGVCEMTGNYILFVRPSFLQDKDPGYLILNRWGKQMNVNGIWAVVKRCVRLAGIKKNITTHSLRHACATHMLRNGAPVRHIQEMLGHESLESTQVYTHITINDLKEIHAKYHPGEDMEDKPDK